MKYENVRMNEVYLVNNFTKKELLELLDVQIKHENYEGAIVIKNAIDGYEDYENTEFDYYVEVDLFSEDDEDNEENIE